MINAFNSLHPKILLLYTQPKTKKKQKKQREMLTSALSTLVKNSIKGNFDITFMKNEKNCQNINCFFFFSYKNFF